MNSRANKKATKSERTLSAEKKDDPSLYCHSSSQLEFWFRKQNGPGKMRPPGKTEKVTGKPIIHKGLCRVTADTTFLWVQSGEKSVPITERV